MHILLVLVSVLQEENQRQLPLQYEINHKND